MGIKELFLQKLGDEVIKKVKELDKHETAEFIRGLFLEHAEGLLEDTDGDGKAQVENAMDEIEQAFEHLSAAARILHGVKKKE